MTLRPFEKLRVAPSSVEGRLASLAQGKPPRLASVAQGRPLRLASVAQGKLLRFMATWTVAFLVAGSSSVLACPLCFGAEETSLVDGTKLGVLVMLGVTLMIEGLFVAFFLHLRRRARRMAEADFDTEWSDLQRSRS